MRIRQSVVIAVFLVAITSMEPPRTSQSSMLHEAAPEIPCRDPVAGSTVAGQSTPPDSTASAPGTDAPLPGNTVFLFTASCSLDQHLHPVDPKTGHDIVGRTPIHLGMSWEYAVSPDRNWLAAWVYSGAEPVVPSRDFSLHLIDLRRWTDGTVDVQLEGPQTLTFSPDGARLAIIADHALAIVDLAAQRVTAKRKKSLGFDPWYLWYTPDGTALLVYGMVPDPTQDRIGGPLRAALLDAGDLHTDWQTTLAGVRDGHFDVPVAGVSGGPQSATFAPAAVASPGRRDLYVVAADRDELTHVDFAHRSVRTVRWQDPRPAPRPFWSWPWRWPWSWLSMGTGVAYAKGDRYGLYRYATLSPDGTRLYLTGSADLTGPNAAGQWEPVDSSLGLVAIDVATGAVLAHIDEDRDYGFGRIEPSPDGSRLFASRWSSADGREYTEVLDARTLDLIARVDAPEAMPGQELDGSPVLLSRWNDGSYQHSLMTLDPVSFVTIHSWSVEALDAYWLEMR